MTRTQVRRLEKLVVRHQWHVSELKSRYISHTGTVFLRQRGPVVERLELMVDDFKPEDYW
ncbi:hypothetical protein NEOLEDRAFT_1142102 [Neolentinus lepideus HHB14362 ss-1]|uniref:Uncharacterized protein n=1 Tax=Neolentinus lepideus HHB14362 ss-1 TaxID=1314782 RepID=A0A165NBI2_9AGAM|nr:hypothetical protein NEOLEDRAFT_1142102 [Neolentinus lepideus HHB14362 ss-1]